MTVCLVTGGAGFLGSHLVEALLERGHQVRVLDNLSTGDLANLAASRGRFELTVADIRDLNAVRHATEGVERVFHLAVPAACAAGPGVEDPVDLGTLQVLIAARESMVRRVVYASSLCVYGDARGNMPGAGRSEREAPQPVSPYARTKLCGEQDCVLFTHLYGLETVRLRYASIFGPRQPASQRYAQFVPFLIGRLLAGRLVRLPGDGFEPMDLLDVRDAVQAALLASEAESASGQVYNIGRGAPVTPLELFLRVRNLTGGHAAPLLGGPMPPAEFSHLADISRARSELGFRPGDDLDAQLARCVEQARCEAPPPFRGPRLGVHSGS